MVMEDLTLGFGLTMQYIDDASLKCTLETYMTLLTNFTPTNLIENKLKKELGLYLTESYRTMKFAGL